MALEKFKAMQLFVSTVELGSFAAAGEAMGISAPMVTKHLQELEEGIGATLLIRTTRNRHLTEVGQRYYESCKIILEEVRKADADALELQTMPKGRLRINAAVAFSTQLAPIVAEYLLEHPEVTVELTLNDRFVDIVDEGFDMAIRIGKLDDSSLVARSLGNYDLTICASPDYLSKYGYPETPADLSHHHCLGFTLWRGRSGWKEFLSRLSSSPTTRMESNNVDTLHIAALQGVGILLIPRRLIQEDLKQNRLVEILQDHLPPALPINIVYPKTRQSSSKLKSFVDFMIENYKSQES